MTNKRVNKSKIYYLILWTVYVLYTVMSNDLNFIFNEILLKNLI